MTDDREEMANLISKTESCRPFDADCMSRRVILARQQSERRYMRRSCVVLLCVLVGGIWCVGKPTSTDTTRIQAVNQFEPAVRVDAPPDLRDPQQQAAELLERIDVVTSRIERRRSRAQDALLAVYRVKASANLSLPTKP